MRHGFRLFSSDLGSSMNAHPSFTVTFIVGLVNKTKFNGSEGASSDGGKICVSRKLNSNRMSMGANTLPMRLHDDTGEETV